VRHLEAGLRHRDAPGAADVSNRCEKQ
jgi:hypothetical protein